MVEVILAGYNVDREALEELVGKGESTQEDLKNLTPESISAAYAHISRDPRSATKLREVTREEVEKARRSNKTIVFKMGHQSIAEHAVLNFDILGISRLAIEFLEAQRLCSYTEKSQRYITMKGDYVTPREFRRVEPDFHKIVNFQNKTYFELYDVLKDYFRSKKEFIEKARYLVQLTIQSGIKIKDPEKAAQGTLDGWAKEDARYVLCMATEGQLGFTTNARDLEKFIKYCAASPLYETRDLGKKLQKQGGRVASSLLLFFEPNDYFRNSRKRMTKYVLGLLPGFNTPHIDVLPRSKGDEEVRLVEWGEQADNKLVATLIQAATNTSFQEAFYHACRLGEEKKINIVKKALENREQWDPVPREFEKPYLTYDIMMSSSCFAQFKRHRMLTLLPLAYDPEKLGYTVPLSVTDAGLETKFKKVMSATDDDYAEFKKKKIKPEALPYVLTNAHNRRVNVKMNARELYAASRLRLDLSAQWDIRGKYTKMSKLARQVMPLTFLMLCGKHEFQKSYNKVYSN